MVALVEAVLPLLGPAERWAVYTVPGPRDLPGPDASRGRRDRWWRDHISAVGEALVLTDPDVDPEAVRRAVELLTVCALARERDRTDPVELVHSASHRGPGPTGVQRVAESLGAAPRTALEAVLLVAGAVTPSPGS